jgi:hypothetical protein
MALYIGNPTNVVVAEAYGISFINYSAWMLLPTVICIILSYVVLRVLFRGEYYLPRKIQPPEADPKSVLIDPKGAIFGLVLLACCLATLIGTSFANVPVWMITLPYAVAMLVRDIRHDLGISFSKMFRLKPQQPRPVFHNPTSIDEAISHGIQALPLETLHGQDSATTIPTTMDQIATSSSGGLSHNPLSTATEKEMENQQAPTIITQIEETIVQRQSQDISRLSNSHHSYQSTIIDRTKGNQNSGLLGAYEKTVGVIVQVVMKGWHWFCDRFPTISAVTKRMPWTILPFSLGMFVLIEALAHVGWVSIFATAMSVFAKNYATAVLGMVFVSIIACQILNNLVRKKKKKDD